MTKQTSPIVDTSQDAAFNRELAETSTPTVTAKLIRPKLTWVPDKPDARDYAYKLTTVPTVTKVDLRSECTPVGNQGQLGSCTGHAISSAMELILKRKSTTMELSRLFIYYQARLLEGTVNYDAGAYIRDGIKACNKLGAANEKLWPYNLSLWKKAPSVAATKDALTKRVTQYQRCADFTAVKNAITAKNPVVIGFLVYSSFLSAATTKTGVMTYPNTKTESILGGHAVCLVGFDDARQVFIAKNSWGTAWGDRGYFYMPYKVIQNSVMASDFWVIAGVTA